MWHINRTPIPPSLLPWRNLNGTISHIDYNRYTSIRGWLAYCRNSLTSTLMDLDAVSSLPEMTCWSISHQKWYPNSHTPQWWGWHTYSSTIIHINAAYNWRERVKLNPYGGSIRRKSTFRGGLICAYTTTLRWRGGVLSLLGVGLSWLICLQMVLTVVRGIR